MQFVAGGKTLTVRLEGLEKIWALKSHLDIPKEQILEIDYKPVRPAVQDFKGYVRVPGTALPWLFLAGTFRTKASKEFWFIRMRQPGILTLTLKPNVAVYDRVRLTCEPEIAQSLVDWWRGRVKP